MRTHAHVDPGIGTNDWNDHVFESQRARDNAIYLSTHRKEFHQWLQKKYAHRTQGDIRRYTDRYISDIGIKNRKDIEKAIKDVKKSKNNIHKALRVYINFLVDDGIINENQALDLKKPLVLTRGNADTWVPDVQIIHNTIKSCQNPSKLLVFYIAICSGIRVSEIGYLFDNFNVNKLHDVDNISYYDIDWRRGKKNSNKAFMPRKVANMIRRHTDKPSINAAQRYFQAHYIPLKYCRNFFINMCTKEGVPDSIIEYMIGHTGGSVLSINYIQKHQRAIEWYQKIEPKITEIINIT